MKEFATKYINWYEKHDDETKAMLCLLYNVPTNLYRFCKSALKDSDLGMFLAVILCMFSGYMTFLIDIILILTTHKVMWLDDLEIEDEILKFEGVETDNTNTKTDAKATDSHEKTNTDHDEVIIDLEEF